MLTRVPRDIPLFLALAVGLGLAAFGFTELHMDARPSSTAALAYLFIPFWAVALGGAAFLFGLAIRGVWKRIFPEQVGPEHNRWMLPVLLVIIVITAASLGALDAVRVEEAARPATLVDSGRLLRAFVANADSRIREGKLIYEIERIPEPIVWGANSSALIIGYDQVQLVDRANARKVKISTGALDYITQVHAVPIALSNYSQPGLVLVIAGRATGRRAIVMVLGPSYEVLLEERLYRFWELSSATVEVRANRATGEELVVVGPGCEKSLVIRSRRIA